MQINMSISLDTHLKQVLDSLEAINCLLKTKKQNKTKQKTVR